ncbi:hypothetical protein FAZ15_00880 [Sphingobacterium olei]|uniref:OmpA-like domain-containing protein n=1 Tax=Sphingobacterium olei TaxID=2571155 RepID=A0A4U0P659_9SPHI|nr:OmpA family protein [Sphingobacterium olei]TJZ62893.1 hypothetical protein FAZ15_00880 [Sphingobacterium olei]
MEKSNTVRNSMFLAVALSSVFSISPVHSQGILKRVKSKAESTTVNKILNETDKAVSKGIDKAIESVSTSEKSKTTPQQEEKPMDAAPNDLQVNNNMKSYSKYEFVPGDSILYVDDFSGSPIGELPAGWNGNGSSVVVNLDNIPGRWLRMAQKSVVLSGNEQGFGQDFSVEFDMIFDIDFKGWVAPSFQFGLLASGEKSPSSNTLLNEQKGDKSFYMEISPQTTSGTYTLDSYEKYIRYFNSSAKTDNKVKDWYGKIVHVSIQVQKERLRIWINGEKIYDIPKAIAKMGELNQLFFKLASSPYDDEQIGVFLGNIKIAKGLFSPIQQLMEKGSFSTTGILFDTGSSLIKPESFGIIKSIANLLIQDTELRLQIAGHTDNVGDEQRNLVLSQQRAAAIKSLLESEYGIGADRLETLGKGESVPISTNTSEAGKAKNRRVEFIKL